MEDLKFVFAYQKVFYVKQWPIGNVIDKILLRLALEQSRVRRSQTWANGTGARNTRTTS